MIIRADVYKKKKSNYFRTVVKTKRLISPHKYSRGRKVIDSLYLFDVFRQFDIKNVAKKCRNPRARAHSPAGTANRIPGLNGLLTVKIKSTYNTFRIKSRGSLQSQVPRLLNSYILIVCGNNSRSSVHPASHI